MNDASQLASTVEALSNERNRLAVENGRLRAACAALLEWVDSLDDYAHTRDLPLHEAELIAEDARDGARKALK